MDTHLGEGFGFLRRELEEQVRLDKVRIALGPLRARLTGLDVCVHRLIRAYVQWVSKTTCWIWWDKCMNMVRRGADLTFVLFEGIRAGGMVDATGS